MTTIFKQFKEKGLKYTILTTAFSILVSFNTIGQVISNPTVLNSMSLSNVTSTSATLSWLYRSNEFDSAPAYILYSRTSSQTLYSSLAAISLGSIVYSQTPQSKSLNVAGLQPNTTYIWFLNVLDEARGMSEPLLMNNYNNGAFLGYSFLTTSTYQLITFTTPNANGTGGTTGSLTTITNSTIPPNQLPIANAGPDVVLSSPVNSTTLSALASTDADGGIQSFTWSKVGGPSSFSLGQSSGYGPTPTVSNLVQGTYTFRLVVTDSRGDFVQDFVNVVVDGGGVNQLPSVFAGVDKTIALPPNSSSTSITLSGSAADPDGFITNYLWTKISGPGSFIINNPANVSTLVSNLVPGTYFFQLTATDNRGGSANDIVQITINGAIPPPACSNDNFESNNTLGTAAAINVGAAITAKICPLTDVDFFKFNNRNAQRNIRVTLFNLPTNYILQLFAPDGSLSGTSNATNTQNKVIVFNTATVGTYKIKVSAGTGASVTNNSYSLLAEINKNNFARPAPGQSSGAKQSPGFNSDLPVSSAFDVYPNPATDVVSVAIPPGEQYGNISVFNMSGQLMKTTISQKNITSTSVADLSQGFYVIKIITASGKIFSKRIRVNK